MTKSIEKWERNWLIRPVSGEVIPTDRVIIAEAQRLAARLAGGEYAIDEARSGETHYATPGLTAEWYPLTSTGARAEQAETAARLKAAGRAVEISGSHLYSAGVPTSGGTVSQVIQRCAWAPTRYRIASL